MQAQHKRRRGVRHPLDAIQGRYVEEDRGYDTRCWIWQHSVNGSGRPYVYYPGRNMVLAHRLAYEGLHGSVPDRKTTGLTLDHLCCQPMCVNPTHLEAVSDHENRRRAGQIKLSDGDVREIRRLLAEGRLYQREIGDLFGVCDATISLINTRTNWAGLT